MAETPLSLVCIEPRFPGRLGATADWLVRKRGYRCQFYSAVIDPPEYWPASTGFRLEVIRFTVGGVAQETAVPWLRSFERGLCYAHGCYEALETRRPRPVDLVVGRSDFLGSTLFARVALPGVPVVNLFDYWVTPHANDLTHDLAPAAPAVYSHWRRSAPALDLLEFERATAAWTQTAWQRDLFPSAYRADLFVCHDGVDTARYHRHATGPRSVAGQVIPDGMRVVSFVARRLDQLRGFDRFVTLANRLLACRNDLLFLVVGGAPVERTLDMRYHGCDYRGVVLAQEPLADPGRFWFLGEVAPAVVAEVLAASDLHVYPSRPYPVARSLLEAMAAGCIVLAWETEPVREFVEHGRSGLFVASGDMDAAVRQACRVLDDPAAHRPLGEEASGRVRQAFDRDVTLPRLAAWFDQLVGRAR